MINWEVWLRLMTVNVFNFRDKASDFRWSRSHDD